MCQDTNFKCKEDRGRVTYGLNKIKRLDVLFFFRRIIKEITIYLW